MNIVPVPMEGSAAVPTGYYPSGSASHTRPDSSSGVKHSYLHERLQSSSIAMSPVCVIVTFVAIGCLFITLGATIMALSGDVVHCVVPYEYSGEAVYRWVKVTSKDCEPENGVEELKEPVYVYYQLEDFYQNHRKYVKSRSDAQLEGNWRGQESMIKNCEPRRNVFDLFDVETDDATRRKERSKHTCDALDRTGQGPDEPTYTLPYGRTFNKSTQTIDQPLPPIENCDALLYPCGLIATTVFTDSYRLYDATQEMDNLTASEGSPAPLATGDEDEDEDDEEKYAENAWLSNETVAEAAERAGVSVAAAARKVDTRAETIAWKADVERFKNIKFDHEESDVAKRRGLDVYSWLDKNLFADGIMSGHFIVWMRTAGLPHFRKLWGKLDTKVPLPIYVEIHNNYNTSQSSSKKSFVLATASWLGGRNVHLGIAYVVVGCLAFFIGLIFLIQHMRSNKSHADTIQLSWGG